MHNLIFCAKDLHQFRRWFTRQFMFSLETHVVWWTTAQSPIFYVTFLSLKTFSEKWSTHSPTKTRLFRWNNSEFLMLLFEWCIHKSPPYVYIGHRDIVANELASFYECKSNTMYLQFYIYQILFKWKLYLFLISYFQIHRLIFDFCEFICIRVLSYDRLIF